MWVTLTTIDEKGTKVEVNLNQVCYFLPLGNGNTEVRFENHHLWVKETLEEIHLLGKRKLENALLGY